MFYRNRNACNSRWVGIAVAGLIGMLAGCSFRMQPAAYVDHPPASLRWESAIQKFEREDAQEFPPAGGVVFVGSSSIRKWDTLTADFGDLSVIRRGFGGSHLEDAVYFADRIILPYRPKAVVVYAGDNDLAAGKSPERVAGDFRRLAFRIHSARPFTPILFISVKASTARWHLRDSIREANRLVRSQCTADPRLFFVDVFHPMLNDEGKPQRKLLQDDGLHLTPEGYRLWAKLVRSALENALVVMNIDTMTFVAPKVHYRERHRLCS